MNKFTRNDLVRKTKGSKWQGRVVGQYSTRLTPEGYCVESSTEVGSVQIYPASALELVPDKAQGTAKLNPLATLLREAREAICNLAEDLEGEEAEDVEGLLGEIDRELDGVKKGGCEQRGLASDEVDELCHTVHGKPAEGGQ